MAANTFNNAKPKEPKPSSTIMPTLASPSSSLPKSSIQSQHTSLSLEVASCQEDSKNDREKNIKKDQNKKPSMSSNYSHDVFDPFHDLVHTLLVMPPCLKSSPKKDQATTCILKLIDD